MKFVVDAHVWLWFLAGAARLSTPARAVLQDQADQFVLPATACAEACWIVEHGRAKALSVKDVQAALDADARFTVHPPTRAVIERSHSLAAINEMHDRQIVATALVLADGGAQVALLTHDANITASSVVTIVW